MLKGAIVYASLKNALQILTYVNKASGNNLVMHCDQIRWQYFSRGYESTRGGIDPVSGRRQRSEGQDDLLLEDGLGLEMRNRSLQEDSQGFLEEYVLGK